MAQVKANPTINLIGEYQLDPDTGVLTKEGLTLKAGVRLRPKRNQSKRYLCLIDPTKSDDNSTYLSGLFIKRGEQHAFSLEYEKQYYTLQLLSNTKAQILKQVKEKPLVFSEAR